MNLDTLFTQNIYAIITILVGGLFTFITKSMLPQFQSYLLTKENIIKNDQTRGAVESATNTLFEVVENIVNSVDQTMVNSLKAVSDTGKLTTDQIVEAKNKAITAIKNTLTDEAKELLTTKYSNLDEYIDHLIESTVRNLDNTPIKPDKMAITPDTQTC